MHKAPSSTPSTEGGKQKNKQKKKQSPAQTGLVVPWDLWDGKESGREQCQHSRHGEGCQSEGTRTSSSMGSPARQKCPWRGSGPILGSQQEPALETAREQRSSPKPLPRCMVNPQSLCSCGLGSHTGEAPALRALPPPPADRPPVPSPTPLHLPHRHSPLVDQVLEQQQHDAPESHIQGA